MTTAEFVQVTTDDGPMAIYDVPPDGAARGAVIVVQEAFGVNDHIQHVARRLAEEGYHAVAPDFFHRAGGGVAPYDDFSKVMPLLEGLDDDAILVDVDAALGHLHAAGHERGATGIVGFCMGGRVAFLAAARRPLGGAVSFYGGGIAEGSQGLGAPLHEEGASLQTPWLGLFGDLDAMIPVEGVEALRSVVAAAPVATEIVRYPDAGHGFHCDARGDYHEASAADAWQRTLDWFGRHLA